MRDPEHPRRFTGESRYRIATLTDSDKLYAGAMRRYSLDKSTLGHRIRQVNVHGSTAPAGNRIPEQDRPIGPRRKNTRARTKNRCPKISGAEAYVKAIAMTANAGRHTLANPPGPARVTALGRAAKNRTRAERDWGPAVRRVLDICKDTRP